MNGANGDTRQSVPRLPRAGEVYDLRSPGERERNEPARLWRVVEVCSERMDEPKAVLCTSVKTGGVDFWPLRHFTFDRRAHDPGLCIYCDKPVRKGGVTINRTDGFPDDEAHAKCHREACR